MLKIEASETLLLKISEENKRRADQGKKGINPFFLGKELNDLFWDLWKNKSSILFDWFPKGSVKMYRNGQYKNYYFFPNATTRITESNQSNLPIRCQGCGKEDYVCCEIWHELGGCP